MLVIPKSIPTVREYLANIPGIGRVVANKVILRFAEEKDILTAIANDPVRVEEASDKHSAEIIIAHLQTKWASHEAEMFLHSVGLRKGDIKSVYMMLREQTKAIISANPFAVMDTIGFKKCDSIAHALNLAQNMPERLDAGITWIAETACMRSGHCAVVYDDSLITDSADTLGVSVDDTKDAIARMLASGKLIAAEMLELNLLYPRRFWQAEQGVIEHLYRIASSPVRELEIKTDLSFKPSEDQIDAILKIARSKVSVLTGAPGTGKTAIIKCILNAAQDAEMKVVLCAPTGIAARRMQKSCEFKATTIHRALGENSDVSLKTADLIVVDEMSMVAIELFNTLLSKLRDDVILLLVGDPNQLPSIDPGSVLSDIIDSGMIGVSRLVKIHRQGEGSLICKNAARILNGEMPCAEDGNNEFVMLFYDEPQTIANATGICAERLLAGKPELLLDMQVIVPTKNNLLGAEGLNGVLRAKLNKSAAQAHGKYAESDKTIQIENNYDKGVVNGEIGRVSFVGDSGDLVVAYDDHSVRYANNELAQVAHAYAITVHKSQGSEFSYLILVIARSHGRLLTRCLVYTAITRGKKQVIIIGHRSALQEAIENNRREARYTGLATGLAARFAQSNT
jgi:exodeoxyribonuclease V alpha subunit